MKEFVFVLLIIGIVVVILAIIGRKRYLDNADYSNPEDWKCE